MSCGKVKQNTLMTHSGKREEEKPQKRRKENRRQAERNASWLVLPRREGGKRS